jgi:TIGR03009 family protein
MRSIRFQMTASPALLLTLAAVVAHGQGVGSNVPQAGAGASGTTVRGGTNAQRGGSVTKQTARPGSGADSQKADSAKNGTVKYDPMDPNVRARMEKLLVVWSERSQQIKTVSTRYKETDVQPGLKINASFEGVARLQSPNLLSLEKTEVAPKNIDPKDAEKLYRELVVSTGEKIYKYSWLEKQVQIYTLDKDERARAMQEGPLPFLFNMRIADAKKRFDMYLLGETPQAYLVQILPKQAEDKEEFSLAYIELDKKLFMPNRLILVNPNGNPKDHRTFVFSDVELNQKIDPRLFKPRQKQKGWQEVNVNTDQQESNKKAARRVPIDQPRRSR